VTTVGTDQTLTKPLLDADTGGVTRLCAGPEYRRHNLRFFLRMPSEDEAEKLPCPMGFDRKSVTFEPYMLVLPNPLPHNVTAQFYRINTPDGRGKIGKRKLHLWHPEVDTAIYPSLAVNVGSLQPGQPLELHGTSYWYNPRSGRRTTRQSTQTFVNAAPDWMPPPPVVTYSPFQILVMIRMKWLPATAQDHRTEYVSGSPIHAPAPAMPPLYPDPAPFTPSPGWRDGSSS
jgi:hypothetical protein